VGSGGRKDLILYRRVEFEGWEDLILYRRVEFAGEDCPICLAQAEALDEWWMDLCVKIYFSESH
jgi:hypothetical protein